MTTLPTMTLYSGDIPDKNKMNETEFANAVFPYMNYVSNTFVKQMQDFTKGYNTLKEEIEDAHTDITDKYKVVVDTEAKISPYYNNIDTVVDNVEDVNKVVKNIEDINKLVKNMSDVNDVVENMSDVNKVVENMADVNDISNSLEKVNNVADSLEDVKTLNENTQLIKDVVDNIDDIKTASQNIDDVFAPMVAMTNNLIGLHLKIMEVVK
ncbi:MAG: hypothetical protein ABGW74_04170 [Campylobacterales bacterium]